MSTSKAPRAQYYPIAGRPGLWGWRAVGANGRLVATGEPNGYSGKTGAIRAFERAKEIFAEIVRSEFLADEPDDAVISRPGGPNNKV